MRRVHPIPSVVFLAVTLCVVIVGPAIAQTRDPNPTRSIQPVVEPVTTTSPSLSARFWDRLSSWSIVWRSPLAAKSAYLRPSTLPLRAKASAR